MMWSKVYSVFLAFLCFFCHCVVCPSSYGFWIPLWYIQSPLSLNFKSLIFSIDFETSGLFFFNCMYIIYYIIHLKRQLLLFKESKYSQDKKQTICISLLCISTLCNNCLFYNKGLFYLFVSFNFLDSIKTPPPLPPNDCFLFEIILKDKNKSVSMFTFDALRAGE